MPSACSGLSLKQRAQALHCQERKHCVVMRAMRLLCAGYLLCCSNAIEDLNNTAMPQSDFWYHFSLPALTHHSVTNELGGLLKRNSTLAFSPVDKHDLRHAVSQWLQNAKQATAKYGHIAAWNTSRVTDMSGLFQGVYSFSCPIGSWDTSSVTNMSHMFASANAFNEDIGRWNTTCVTDMSYMFHAAHAFDRDIGAWDTGRVTDMSYMFAQATSFKRDISGWSVCSVRDMSNMFCEAYEFRQLGLLKASWAMSPAACGKAARSLTWADVNRCMEAAGISVVSELPDATSPTAHGYASLGALGVCIAVACGLSAVLACRCKRSCCRSVELSGGKQHLIPRSQDEYEDELSDASSQIPLHLATLDRSAAASTNHERLQFVEIGEELGCGPLGRTCAGLLYSLDSRRSVRVAVKFLRHSAFSWSDARALQELSMIPGGVQHPNLIQLLAYVTEEAIVTGIVMELCDRNLQSLREETTLHVSEQLLLMVQVAAGCAWIARNGGSHGNLKMQNILITTILDTDSTRSAEGEMMTRVKHVAKVTDFGMASRGVMAPETVRES
eukprot:3210498-Amphidinium_carterae.2